MGSPLPESVKKTPFAPTSSVKFHELVVHREPGRIPLLGCTRVRRFLEVDEETIAAVEAIRATPTLADAERMLEEKTGTSFDLMDFVQRLYERGFIRSIDGQDLASESDARERHKFLHGVDLRFLRWLHSPAVFIASGILVLAWVAALIDDPTLRPGPGDLFLFHRPALVALSVLGGFIGLAYLHELAHFFVAKSYGVDATIHASHRYYMFVLQTDVTNAWLLPARQKVVIFLAGMGMNLVISAVAGLALILAQAGVPASLEPWAPHLRFLIALNLFPLVFQLFIFARTDLYHVLLAVTGSRNLVAAGMAYVRYRIVRIAKQLRGTARQSCAECSSRPFLDDPFCMRCGASLPVDDPNKYPFKSKGRRSLLAFGLLFYVAAIGGYTFFFAFAGPALVRQIRLASGFLEAAIAIPSFWRILEAEWVLIFAALPLIFVVYTMAKSTVLVIRFILFKMRGPKTARPTGAASALAGSPSTVIDPSSTKEP